MTRSELKLERVALLLVFAMWAAHLLMIWIYRFVPSTDYPEWLLQANILAHYNEPAYGFAQWYEIVYAPVPNGGFVLPTAFLAKLLPIEIAGKIVLSVYIIWLPLAVRSYVRTLHGSTSFWTISVLLLFNVSFTNGNIAFLIGTCIFFHLLSLGEKEQYEPTFFGVVGQVLLTAALFFAHAACAVVYLLYIIVRLLDKRENYSRTSPLAISALFLLFLGIVYYFTRPTERMILQFDWGIDWRYRVSVLSKSFVAGLTFPPYDFSILRTLTNGMLVVFIAGVCFLSLRLAAQRWSSSTLAKFTILLLIISLIAPRLFMGIGEPSQRLAFLLCLLLLGSLRVTNHGKKILQSCLLILAVLVTFVRWQDIRMANSIITNRYEFLRPILPPAHAVATIDDDLGKERIPFFHFVPKGINFIFQTDYHLLSGGYNPWSFRTGYVLPRPLFSQLIDSLSSGPLRKGPLVPQGRDIPQWIDYVVLDSGSDWEGRAIEALEPYFALEARKEIATGIHTIVLKRVR